MIKEISLLLLLPANRHASLGRLLAAGLPLRPGAEGIRRRPRAHQLDRGARLFSRVLAFAGRACEYKDSQYHILE
jgi:hypothetical protein